MALETVYWMAQSDSDVGRQRVADCWYTEQQRTRVERTRYYDFKYLPIKLHFWLWFECRRSSSITQVSIKYSMRDLICDVIGHSAWNCDMGKVNTNYKVLIVNLIPDKRWGSKTILHEFQSEGWFSNGFLWRQKDRCMKGPLTSVAFCDLYCSFASHAQ